MTKKEGGRDRIIDRLYAGQYFGERALIKREPRMASTRATSELECYSLSKAEFEELALREDVAWSRRWDMEDTRDVSQLRVRNRPTLASTNICLSPI